MTGTNRGIMTNMLVMEWHISFYRATEPCQLVPIMGRDGDGECVRRVRCVRVTHPCVMRGPNPSVFRAFDRGVHAKDPLSCGLLWVSACVRVLRRRLGSDWFSDTVGRAAFGLARTTRRDSC